MACTQSSSDTHQRPGPPEDRQGGKCSKKGAPFWITDLHESRTSCAVEPLGTPRQRRHLHSVLTAQSSLKPCYSRRHVQTGGKGMSRRPAWRRSSAAIAVRRPNKTLRDPSFLASTPSSLISFHAIRCELRSRPRVTAKRTQTPGFRVGFFFIRTKHLQDHRQSATRVSSGLTYRPGGEG